MRIICVDDEQLQLMSLTEAVKQALPGNEILSYSNPVLCWEENKEAPAAFP